MSSSVPRGERGVEAVFGVIYPPPVALVGFGSPVDRPRVVAAETANLDADHRLRDSHRGALFLAVIGLSAADWLVRMPMSNSVTSTRSATGSARGRCARPAGLWI